MSDERMRDRFAATIAVFVMVLNDQSEVLLQRRIDTGYMDGFYDFPSGHLEAGETLTAGAARETLEEVGICIREEDLSLLHVNQNNASAEFPYMNFVFKATIWTGEPSICEPDKSDDCRFFKLTDLPRVTPQVKVALADIQASRVTFSYFTEKDFEPRD